MRSVDRSCCRCGALSYRVGYTADPAAEGKLGKALCLQFCCGGGAGANGMLCGFGVLLAMCAEGLMDIGRTFGASSSMSSSSDAYQRFYSSVKKIKGNRDAVAIRTRLSFLKNLPIPPPTPFAPF